MNSAMPSNETEAEFYTGIKIKNENDAKKIAFSI